MTDTRGVTAYEGTGADRAVRVTARGEVPADVRRYAEEKVRRACSVTSRPVLSARVTLTLAADPAHERPARADAVLDVNGTVLDGHAEAGTLREAIDQLEALLRRRLVEHHDRTRGRRRAGGAGA